MAETKRTGYLVISRQTHDILASGGDYAGMTGKCYACYNQAAPCADCPALNAKPGLISVRRGSTGRPDVAALGLTGDRSGQILILFGEIGHTLENPWMLENCYQTILKQTATITFEYNLDTGTHFDCPFIGELLMGNFDGRRLSEVLLDDEVVYPPDVWKAERFRDQSLLGLGDLQVSLRLRCKDGIYRWHKLTSHYFEEGGWRLVVGTIINVDEEVKLRESLRCRAEYDGLTGVYNKETFQQKAKEILDASPHTPHVFVQMDIDRFKTVNELFGKREGDKILKLFARTLSNLTENGELCARLGNDVFGILLSRTGAETTQFVTEVNAALNQYPVDFDFIISAGVCCVKNYQGEPVNLLLDHAGLAQRSIKGNFINRVAFYQDYMGKQLAREHFIIGSVKRAIANREFMMFLQPKFDMRTEEMIGAEALVRWRHPTEGLIMPGEFIPLFEKNGFIMRLDEYMWDCACQSIRKWLDAGIRPPRISVNVSRMHLYDNSFCDKITALMKRYSLSPEMLELEITESAYVENPLSLIGVMENLQAKGFLFSMDDFGSGYSSLSMLKDIPVDILKIDLNFLKQSRREQVGEEVLAATLQLAQRLRFPVIAEGVETKEQVRFLLDSGCSQAQGYFYDKPLPLAAFEEKYLRL